MNLEASGYSFPVGLGQGRIILYNLYAQKNPLNPKSDLQNKIEQFISDLGWFDSTCKLILEDEMPAAYSFKFHHFTNEEGSEPFDPLRSKRDFLVNGIKELAKRLISPYEEELGPEMKRLESYLSHKLLKETSFASVDEFIAKGSEEETLKGQHSLLKLFGKIESGKFLSEDQKQQKLLAKQSMNELKNSSVSQADEAAAEQAPDGPIVDSSAMQDGNQGCQESEMIALLASLIKKVEKRKVHSAEGRELKKGLTEELKLVREHLLANKEISGIGFKVLYNKKVRNILPDELYDEIQTMGEVVKSYSSDEITKPKEAIIEEAGKGSIVPELQQAPLSKEEGPGEALLLGSDVPLPLDNTLSMPKDAKIDEQGKAPLNNDEQILFSSAIQTHELETAKEIHEAKIEDPVSAWAPTHSPWAQFWQGVKNFFQKIFNWFSLCWQKLFSW